MTLLRRTKRWGDEKRKKGIKKLLPLFECGKLQDHIKKLGIISLSLDQLLISPK
jgi:hypothetical protein